MEALSVRLDRGAFQIETENKGMQTHWLVDFRAFGRRLTSDGCREFYGRLFEKLGAFIRRDGNLDPTDKLAADAAREHVW